MAIDTETRQKNPEVQILQEMLEADKQSGEADEPGYRDTYDELLAEHVGVKVIDKSTGEQKIKVVRKIGDVGVGQEVTIPTPNSYTDNWRVSEH